MTNQHTRKIKNGCVCRIGNEKEAKRMSSQTKVAKTSKAKKRRIFDFYVRMAQWERNEEWKSFSFSISFALDAVQYLLCFLCIFLQSHANSFDRVHFMWTHFILLVCNFVSLCFVSLLFFNSFLFYYILNSTWHHTKTKMQRMKQVDCILSAFLTIERLNHVSSFQ